MRKTLKRIGLAVSVLIGLVIAVPLTFLGVTLMRAGENLPQWDASIDVSTLPSRVEVLRDENGVPHVFADTEYDAYYAQGFIHAQDRLWQMLSTRQVLEGRLSEWLGSAALRSDRLNRALRITDTAREDFNLLSGHERALLAAYSAGVNAYLQSSLYRRPPEMVVLYIQPEEWRPHDSLTVLRGVYLTLLTDGLELETQRLTIHGAHPRAVQALDALPFGFLPIIETRMQDSAFVPPVKEKFFSDNWVVTGEYTVSGKPMLANDPQLPSTLPSFWYLMHLSIGGNNLVGGTLPGVPSVPVGRNDRIAWGVTNGAVDQMDFMLLHGHEQNPDLYRRPETGEWQPFETHEEVYEVRFGDPYREKRRSTPLGAIIPTPLMSSPVTKDPNAYVEARAPYLDGDTTMAALIRLNQARNVAEAIDALAVFTGPSLNFTIADVDGGVAYVSAGRYAIRSGEAAKIIDYAPRDSSEWTPIPYRENPHLLAPPSGRIVTANQAAVGADYPYYLSDFWAAPFRAMRIHELLDSSDRHDMASFLAMQNDTLSIPARRFVPELLANAPGNPSRIESAMLQVLREWDYCFTPDATGGTVFLTWLHAFYERLARDEIGETLWPLKAGEALPPIVFQVLEGRHTDWCATAGENETADCVSLLHESLALAAVRLETELGPDPQQWNWDKAAAIQHSHQIFSGLPILGSLFSRTFNYPGGPDTLMVQYVDAREAPRFTQSVTTSSFQAIYDLANLDRSQFMLATGQSGHFRSPYYDNFLPRFAAGERFEIQTRRDAFEPIARLQLRPRD